MELGCDARYADDMVFGIPMGDESTRTKLFIKEALSKQKYLASWNWTELILTSPWSSPKRTTTDEASSSGLDLIFEERRETRHAGKTEWGAWQWSRGDLGQYTKITYSEDAHLSFLCAPGQPIGWSRKQYQQVLPCRALEFIRKASPARLRITPLKKKENSS